MDEPRKMTTFERHMLGAVIGTLVGYPLGMGLFALTQTVDFSPSPPSPTGTVRAAECFGDNPPAKGCPGPPGPSGLLGSVSP